MSLSSLLSSSSGLSSPFSPPKLNWLLMLTMSMASLMLGALRFVKWDFCAFLAEDCSLEQLGVSRFRSFVAPVAPCGSSPVAV